MLHFKQKQLVLLPTSKLIEAIGFAVLALGILKKIILKRSRKILGELHFQIARPLIIKWNETSVSDLQWRSHFSFNSGMTMVVHILFPLPIHKTSQSSAYKMVQIK